MKKRLSVIAMILAAMLLVVSCASTHLTIGFPDVVEVKKTADKWGDCALLKLPGGETMVIDAGIRKVSPYIVDYLKRNGVEKIDYFVMSHSHSDHYGGLVGVPGEHNGLIDNFEIGTVIYNGILTPKTQPIFDDLEKRGIETIILKEGDVMEIGDVRIDVYLPTEEQIENAIDQTTFLNDSSLVMKVTYGETSALFTGDIYVEAERKLVDKYGDELKADILKIPHHGHPTSGSEEFIAAVDADYSVAVGGVAIEHYNYNKYKAGGSKVFLTFVDGDITFTSDGTNWEYETTIERPEKGYYKW